MINRSSTQGPTHTSTHTQKTPRAKFFDKGALIRELIAEVELLSEVHWLRFTQQLEHEFKTEDIGP